MGGCELGLSAALPSPKCAAETELRGGLLPGGDLRENVTSAFIASARGLELFSLGSACCEIKMC